MSDAAAPQLPEGAAPSPEYAAQMTAAGQAGLPEVPAVASISSVPAAPQRPAHIPEKFWDATKGEARWEDMARSYAELESKLGAPPAPAAEVTPPAPEGDPKDTAKVEKTEDAKPAFLAPMEAMREAYASGAVTDDHIAAVEATGIPRDLIDTYLAGVKALEAQGAQQIHALAGGEDNFKAATNWAAQNLTQEELDGYNAICDQPATRKQAIEWLMSKYQSANPAEGKLLDTTTTAPQGDVYGSSGEMQAAFADPRYKTDPAFRQQVAEKTLRSQRAGTINVNTEFYRRGR